MKTPTPDTGTLAGTALETVGNPFDKDLGRDAVHIATVAVTSDERLWPGQHVGLAGGFKVSAKTEKLIGIADPFIATAINPGQHFWLFLYPRTITGLRHMWTHPAFVDRMPNEEYESGGAADTAIGDKAASEAWIENFIRGSDCPDYETVMKTIRADWNEDGYICGRMDGDYLFFGGSDAHGEIPPEFWQHVEVVLGHPPRAKPSYFSCSC